MLHAPSALLSSRPRPPRPRSNQLSSSLSRSTSDPTATAISASSILNSHIDFEGNEDINRLVPLMLPGLETPPYTPPLPSLEVRLEPCSKGGEHEEQLIRSAEQLESMLEEAHRTIEERERELSIAASIGKNLLDNNIALRAKQDALLYRVSSPTKVSFRPDFSTLSAICVPQIQIPLYGAKGEYIESMPPPSPGHAVGSKYHDRQGSLDAAENAWTDKQRRRLPPHARTSSASSVSSVMLCREPSSRMHSRSNSELDFHYATLSTPSQLQEQHAQLSCQNAELERQLEDLEDELSKADMNGKKKLRRLGRELGTIKHELESALQRNKELEEKLGKKVIPSENVSQARDRSFGGIRARQAREKVSQDCGTSESELETMSGNSQQPTDVDPDDGLPSASLSNKTESREPIGALSQVVQHVSSPANLNVPNNQKEALLVAQLLDKISELQRMNTSISEGNAEMDEKLEKATRDFEEMKRKYDFLEERVLEAEIRNHSYNIGWDGRKGAIEWRPAGAADDDTAGKVSRKALGNRPMIERHRRLSSLYGGNQPAPHLSRSASARSSRSGTPEKAGAEQHHIDSSSVSLSSPPTLSSSMLFPRSRSSPGSSFESDRWSGQGKDDIVIALSGIEGSAKGTLQTQYVPYGFKRQVSQDVTEDDKGAQELLSTRDTGSPSPFPASVNSQCTSPSDSMRILGHRHHSLASELGNLWPREENLHQEAYCADDNNHATTSTDVPNDDLIQHDITSMPRHSSSPTRFSRSNNEDVVIDEHIILSLMPPGPPNAEAYEDLERALSELPITWEDDASAALHRTLVRDIDAGEQASRNAKTSQAGLSWAYDDSEEDNEENDPWKEEGKGTMALESREMVEQREKADDRAERRRRRLQELAEEMMREEEDEEDEHAMANMTRKTLSALRRLNLDRPKPKPDEDDRRADDRLAEEDAADYEYLNTTRRPGSRGTDYWPVSLRARYHPAMLAQRAKATSQEYFTMVLLWTKFLTVLAVAVIFSIWKGPKAGLGLRRLPQLTPSSALIRRDTSRTP